MTNPEESHPAVNPAENGSDSPGDSTIDMVLASHAQIQSQLAGLISIVTATAAQTQWICQQIEIFYQSMPPFMRKGLLPDGRQSGPNPGT